MDLDEPTLSSIDAAQCANMYEEDQMRMKKRISKMSMNRLEITTLNRKKSDQSMKSIKSMASM